MDPSSLPEDSTQFRRQRDEKVFGSPRLLRKATRRFWTVTAICGGTALIFILLIWQDWNLDPLWRLEMFTQDMRLVFGVKAPVDPNLVLIGIDQPQYSDFFTPEETQADPSLQLLQKNFPWSRAVWANLVTRLGDAGAKVIVLDLLFGGKGDLEGDAALQEALDKFKDRVVIGCNLHDTKSDRGDNFTLDLPNTSILDASSNLSSFDSRVGYVNIFPDRDDVVRSAQYFIAGGTMLNNFDRGTILESLDGRALRAFGHPELIPTNSEPLRFRYAARAGMGYRIHSLGEVMSPNLWRTNYKNGEFFRDKIVLIGPTADIFQDVHKTPFPPLEIEHHSYSQDMLGPEVHLNMIGAALHRNFLRDTSRNQNLLILTLAGILAIVLSFQVRHPLRRLAGIIMICLGYWWLGQWLFNHANLIIPEAYPLLVMVLSGVFVLAYDYFVEQFERARVRRTLERYVSRNIVKDLLDNPESYFNSLEGVRKPVTVLFSDVRDFTTMTESADSTQLVRQLNEYFAEMTQHVFGFEGTLDKFIGDAVMAIWGNIVTQGPEKDAQHAVATALMMRRSLAKLNEGWRARGIRELHIGIGINQGQAIVGNLGSAEKMELTVIGDVVNTASRLEGLTKKFHVDLLLGETLEPLVSEKFILRTVGLIQPKGKLRPVKVFTALGERGAATDPKMDGWLAEYEAAVKLYWNREFEEAAQKFEGCRQSQPEDFLCSLYLKEIASLIKNPPGQNWIGVFVMSEK